MSKLTIGTLIALVLLVVLWISLQLIWKWIPRRPPVDSPGGGEVASGLAALLQETRQAIEADKLDGALLVNLVQQLRRLYERHLAAGASARTEDVVAAIRQNRTLITLLHGFSHAHVARLGKTADEVFVDPEVSTRDKEALRTITVTLPTLRA